MAHLKGRAEVGMTLAFVCCSVLLDTAMLAGVYQCVVLQVAGYVGLNESAFSWWFNQLEQDGTDGTITCRRDF